jgi:hypothetical protein
LLGADNAAVYGAIGVDAQQCAHLAQQGVI